MTETLLSPSNVLLFGRVVEDLKIVDPTVPISPNQLFDERVDVAGVNNLALTGVDTVDGIALKPKDKVLLKSQANVAELGVYTYYPASGTGASATPSRFVHDEDIEYEAGMVIKVRRGLQNKRTFWKIEGIHSANGRPTAITPLAEETNVDHLPSPARRPSGNKFLQSQLTDDAACFARIYGFSYEGTYYELPRPALFLVHGVGIEASEFRTGRRGKANPSRAPGDPSLTGLAAADFDYADDLKVWSYDKADYTIRMDVDTGMFEQVLLDMLFGEGHGVSGAKVSGAKVSGAKVSGAKLSGARFSGWRGDAND